MSKKEKQDTDERRKFNSACFRLNIGANDLVTFYDGDDLTAKVLGQYGGARTRFKLYTSTADVTIQFQSDPATNIYGYGHGFVIHFFGKPAKLEGRGRRHLPPPPFTRSFYHRIGSSCSVSALEAAKPTPLG